MYISIDKKRRFLSYVLQHYTFKKHECTRLLHHLWVQPGILQRIHFVHGATDTSIGIALRATPKNSNSKGSGNEFRFSYHGLKSTNFNSFSTFLRDSNHEPIFLSIEYPGAFVCPHYARVEDTKQLECFIYYNRYKREAEQLLNHLHQVYELERLKNEIDLCLDNRDKNTFYSLTNKFNAKK